MQEYKKVHRDTGVVQGYMLSDGHRFGKTEIYGYMTGNRDTEVVQTEMLLDRQR